MSADRNEEILHKLRSLAEEDYRRFSSSLLPGCGPILGVRLPLLKKIAGEIAAGDFPAYLESAREEFFEELMLQGLVIGRIRGDIEDVLSYASKFIPKIDNWSVCDSFCGSLKLTLVHKERVWRFLYPFFFSEREFEVRFAVVMLLNYYIEQSRLPALFETLSAVRHDGYYAKMAVAWAISACCTKFPAQTLDYLRRSALDDFTYQKALQKIRESYRVRPEDKAAAKEMARRQRVRRARQGSF